MNSLERTNTDTDAITESLMAVLNKQREDYLKEGHVSADVRIDRLRRGMSSVHRFQDKLVDALNADFSCRPRELSMMTDVAGSIGPFKSAIKQVRGWMRPEKRKTMFPLGLFGGRSRIEYQPLGVVGVISPWNFPVNLTFGPLADILGAGNRCMIKPSEFTPAVSEVMAELVRDAWEEQEVAIFTGGPEVGAAFSGLPFDHLLFTGATSVARHIMAAAAKNLVPVTLELGGKSPVLISRSADIKTSVSRIMLGKTMNAGQICLAPDYLLVPEEQLEEVIRVATETVANMYPSLLSNEQYTSVVNERHHTRLSSYIADAEQRGCRVIPINPANEDFSAGTHKIPPTLVIAPENEALCMEEEIFGPLLPIRTYSQFDETIDHINNGPRPLAAYYFGSDKNEEEAILHRTTSGGVCINDVIFHIAQEDMPFGGIGPSGMGSYHGIEGFKTFSHAKSVYSQTVKFNVGKLGGILPPYGKATDKNIKSQIKR